MGFAAKYRIPLAVNRLLRRGANLRVRTGGDVNGVTEDIVRPCRRHADPRWLRKWPSHELTVRERDEYSAERDWKLRIDVRLDQPAGLIGRLLGIEPTAE
jgi:hypothetical protein